MRRVSAPSDCFLCPASCPCLLSSDPPHHLPQPAELLAQSAGVRPAQQAAQQLLRRGSGFTASSKCGRNVPFRTVTACGTVIASSPSSPASRPSRSRRARRKAWRGAPSVRAHR